MRTTILVSIIVFTSIYRSISQPQNSYIQDVAMPSPTAASFGKFEDIPVNMATGIPNISIPLFSLTDGPLEEMVNLRYHAGGVKVSEPASNIGLGFNLQAGGMISRTVLGIKDEDVNGYFYDGYNVPEQTDCDWSEYVYFASQNPTQYETEPDIFTFSFNGFSGKFYFNADNADSNTDPEVVLIPKQDLKVTPLFTNNVNDLDHLRGFEIISPDGTVYIFGYNGVGTSIIEQTQYSGGLNNIPTGWYLKEVKSYDDNYSIDFEYEIENIEYKTPKSYHRSNSSTGGTRGYNIIKVEGYRLTKITNTNSTDTEEIEFVYTNEREDIDPHEDLPGNPAKSLDEIKYSTGVFEKRFVFNYDYWTDNSSDSSLVSSVNDRLRLLSFQEQNSTGNLNKPAYQFDYFTKANEPDYMPNRLSLAIDHWGYYNGVSANNNNNNVLNIPDVTGSVFNGDSCSLTTFSFTGSADRDSYEEPMKYGTLKEITYPEGGKALFDYEANTVYTVEPPSPATILICDFGWPTGICAGITSVGQPNPITFTSGSLSNLEYNWDFSWAATCNPCSPTPVTTGSIEIKVFDINNNPTDPMGAVSYTLDFACTTTYNLNGLLVDLFPDTVTLVSGTPYRFELFGVNAASNFEIIDPQGTPNTGNKEVGGLRIKEFVWNDNIDTANDIKKTYSYNQFIENTKSSGVLYQEPKYHATLTIYPCPGNSCGDSCHPCCTSNCTDSITAGGYVFLQEEAVVPLGSFEGSHIEYEEVEVGYNGNGFKRYTFKIEDVPANNTYPAPPPQLRAESGKTLIERTLSQTYTEKAKIEYTIEPDTNVYSSTRMFKVLISSPINFILATPYQNRTRRFRYKKIIRTLDDVPVTTEYTYDNQDRFSMPVTELVTNSNGLEYKKEFKYPGSTTGLVYSKMANTFNIISPIIYESHFYEMNNSLALVDEYYNQYRFFDPATGMQSSNSNHTPYLNKFNRKEYTFTANDGLVGGTSFVNAEVYSYHPNNVEGKGYPDKFVASNWDTMYFNWNNGVIAKDSFVDHVKVYEYFPNTKLVKSITDIDDQETHFEYDSLIRLSKRRVRSDSVITSYEYQFQNGPGQYNSVRELTEFGFRSHSSNMEDQDIWTYYDGIGRNVQTVNSSSSLDIVQGRTYDNQGRVSKEYELVESTNSNGAYYSIPTNTPYRLSEYYADPLNRIHKVTPPDWYATEYEYDGNTSTEAFDHIADANYLENSLNRTKLIDPNGNFDLIYKDKLGRLVLESQDSVLNTYHLYDGKQRLSQIIPPDASLTDTNLLFRYLYSTDDQITKLKYPDKDTVEYRYNNRDLLTLVQDGNQRGSNEWIHNKYDEYGREVQTGIIVNSNPSGNGNHSFNELLTETFYDGEGSSTTSDPIYIGRVRETRVKELGSTNNFIETIFQYNNIGQLEEESANTYDGGELDISYNFDYADNLLSKYSSYWYPQGTYGVSSNVNEGFTIDDLGRVDSVEINISQLVEGDQLLGDGHTRVIDYEYDIKGSLTSKDLDKLQRIDYHYNDQSWLTKINSSSLGGINKQLDTCVVNPYPNPGAAPSNHTLNDLFYLELKYDDPLAVIDSDTDKSGNISQVIWRTRGRYRQAFGFEYDAYDRIIASNYYELKDNGAVHKQGWYDSSYGYDHRGNITSLLREGFDDDPSCIGFETIDDLTYSYNTTDKSNLLLEVSDTGTDIGFHDVTNVDYGYDNNGNLSTDPQKSISSISYNHLNLPEEFDFGSNSDVTYKYDAIGTKLYRSATDNSTLVDDHKYYGQFERVDSFLYFNHEDVRIQIEPRGSYPNRYQYDYYIKDHLGNTRLIFRDKDFDGKIEIDSIQANNEVVQENHYYPFGMEMNGFWMNDTNVNSNYLYNGKEYNKSLNLDLYGYGARCYDPCIGFFSSNDRFAHKYNYQSPYTYATSNPIKYIDVNGDSIGVFISNKKIKKAFDAFFNTKEGKEYIGQFAAKGQTINGHTFDSDGEYHKKGIDLEYNDKDLGSNNEEVGAITSGGTGGGKIDNGRIKLSISINTTSERNSLIDNVSTITHESLLHVNEYTFDFIDNGKIDFSNDNFYSKTMQNSPSSRHHLMFHYKKNAHKSHPLATRGLRILESVSSQNNLGYTRSQLWKKLWEFQD